MSLRLAFGLINFLLICWIAYRSRGTGPEVLPKPDKACERGTVECV